MIRAKEVRKSNTKARICVQIALIVLRLLRYSARRSPPSCSLPSFVFPLHTDRMLQGNMGSGAWRVGGNKSYNARRKSCDARRKSYVGRRIFFFPRRIFCNKGKVISYGKSFFSPPSSAIFLLFSSFSCLQETQISVTLLRLLVEALCDIYVRFFHNSHLSFFLHNTLVKGSAHSTQPRASIIFLLSSWPKNSKTITISLIVANWGRKYKAYTPPFLLSSLFRR